LLPPPVIEDLEAFNRNLLELCMKDLEREVMIPLPRERFRVFTLEKVSTDSYSFIRYDNQRYSTSPEYPDCEMWLEIGTTELRVLNEKYEEVVVHKRRYDNGFEPVIDFENYIGALSRKPRAFLSSPYFPALPETVQGYLKNCAYAELKKILVTLVPIIRDGKIGDAAAVLELHEVCTTDGFVAAYRALTEDPRALPSVTTPFTPAQQPYLPKLEQYSALLAGRPGGDE